MKIIDEIDVSCPNCQSKNTIREGDIYDHTPIPCTEAKPVQEYYCKKCKCFFEIEFIAYKKITQPQE